MSKNYIAQADEKYYFDNYGSEEELNETNFYVPAEDEYVEASEVYYEDSEIEDWDVSQAKPGLWENIRKKKEREGKNYKPAKTEKEGRPSQDELKKAQSDKPGPKDPRRTPAPKKDQKKGSKKNKPDSAKNPSGKITFSKFIAHYWSNSPTLQHLCRELGGSTQNC